MLNLKNLLCAALAATLFFSASEAEARFGKRSRSSDSEQEEKKEKKKKEDRDESSSSRVHDASPATPSRVHDASPVGSSRPNPPPPPPPPPREHVIVVEPAPTYYVEPAPPPTYYVEPAPPPPPSYYAEPAPVAPLPEVYAPRQDTLFSPLHMGLEAGPAGGGSRANLFLAIEGERLGMEGRLTGLALPTDDGSGGSDAIAAAEVHLTYAIIAQERIRLRLEGGVSYAEAPDLEVFGPSFGTSFEGRLARNLDFEARAQLTPFPYRQVDTQAALALKLYPFALRAGWRTLLMNDAGLVDGEEHQDIFNGPFVGLGLFF